jgi:hypothetical protein
LYGYETLFVTIRGGHRLEVYMNRALSRIFGPKREKVAGGRGTSEFVSFSIFRMIN